MTEQIPAKIPAYTIQGDEVLFEDGVRYRLTSRAGDQYVPNPTKITPEEMYVALTGGGLPPTSAADLAELPKKVDLGAFDPGRFDLRRG